MDTKQFWIPVLISLTVTPVALYWVVVSAGAGHGSYVPATILFPYTMAWATLLSSSITAFAIILAIIQFPVYGAVLGTANVRQKLLPVALVLLAIHAIAIGAFGGKFYYATSDPITPPLVELYTISRFP